MLDVEQIAFGEGYLEADRAAFPRSLKDVRKILEKFYGKDIEILPGNMVRVSDAAGTRTLKYYKTEVNNSNKYPWFAISAEDPEKMKVPEGMDILVFSVDNLNKRGGATHPVFYREFRQQEIYADAKRIQGSGVNDGWYYSDHESSGRRFVLSCYDVYEKKIGENIYCFYRPKGYQDGDYFDMVEVNKIGAV